MVRKYRVDVSERADVSWQGVASLGRAEQRCLLSLRLTRWRCTEIYNPVFSSGWVMRAFKNRDLVLGNAARASRVRCLHQTKHRTTIAVSTLGFQRSTVTSIRCRNLLFHQWRRSDLEVVWSEAPRPTQPFVKWLRLQRFMDLECVPSGGACLARNVITWWCPNVFGCPGGFALIQCLRYTRGQRRRTMLHY